MDIKALPVKIHTLFAKYRYALLILVIGLVLMVLPDFKSQVTDSKADTSVVSQELTLEQKLSQILSQVDGAGNVEVILTVAAGEEVVYQTNDNISNTGDTNSADRDTVKIKDTQRNENGLVKQIIPATYQGAIIVCEGADNLSVRLQIVEAVSKITGLGANRIAVLKMK